MKFGNDLRSEQFFICNDLSPYLNLKKITYLTFENQEKRASP